MRGSRELGVSLDEQPQKASKHHSATAYPTLMYAPRSRIRNKPDDITATFPQSPVRGLTSNVDDRPEMDDKTISGECRDIRQQLIELLSILKNGSVQTLTSVEAPSIQDALERFMLWAGNLGALRKPTSKLSLDARLASSQDVRLYVGRELEKISKALEDRTYSPPGRPLPYPFHP